MMKLAQTRITTPKRAREVLQPVYWLERFLGLHLWAKQREICEAVQKYKHVAVRSCHSAGKSYIAAGLTIWFTYRHKRTRVITTAPTDRQVRGVLWKEINIRWKNAPSDLAGRVLTQELHVTDDRFALGFTTSKSISGQSSGGAKFSGWHAPHVLVVVDEASGVDPSVYTEVAGVLSSDDSHLLEIGNPTNPLCDFAASFKDPKVYKIKISAFDTPNFTTFGITQDDIERDTWEGKITGKLPYPELITPEWVAGRYRKWGKDSPLYQARVLAEFPVASEETLIPLYMVEAAQNRELFPDPRPNMLSVDVAGDGPDFTVIVHRRGPVARIIKREAGGNTMTNVGHIVMAMKETGADYVVVDIIGIGTGVVHRLRELGYRVVAANASNTARDPDRFANARAEWHWLLREDAESGNLDLDPKDEEFLEQLPEIRWKPDSRGRVQIEPKDELKKRLGRSPDESDALVMTRCSGTDVPVIETSEHSSRHIYDRVDRGIRPRWY